jgi:hypothetical protein
MSESRKRGKRSSLWSRVSYVVMAVSGLAGVGGWQVKDQPILQGLFQHVAESNPGGVPLKGEIMRVAAKALSASETFRDPGTFEVKVTTVKLDPGLFKTGQTVNIGVRVRKRDAQDRESVVWDSKPFGDRLTVIGRDDLVAGWATRPFQVEWTPGDRLTVEVWDRRALLAPKQFEMESPQDGTFPLRSGTRDLKLVEWGRHPQQPGANQIAFEAERVADGAGPRTAAGARRDDGTIVIK